MSKVVNAVSPQDMRPGSFRNWLFKPNVQKWLVIITFAIVPVALLLVFLYYPILKMVEFSFYNMSYTRG